METNYIISLAVATIVCLVFVSVAIGFTIGKTIHEKNDEDLLDSN